MRIMMIGPYPRSPDRIDGGVAAAMMYLSKAIAARRDVELIGARIARDGVDSGEDRGLGWMVVDVPLRHLSLSSLYHRQIRRLESLLKRYDPHVVHAQGADLAGFLAVRSDRPAVVTVHGLLGECAKYQTRRRNRLRATLTASLTERPTIRRTTDLITISPFVAEYYRSEIKGRVYDIPNAVAPAFFQLSRNAERGRLLFAGRIAHGKGLVELLHAVAENPATVTKLVLAGAAPDPGYDARLRKEADALGIGKRVNFAGLLSEQELLNEFSLAEALVLPSHQETAPMVVQQAMASGLAVVATTVGGIPYQIQHEVSGLLFKAGSVGELSALIARLGRDATLTRRLGEAGKAIATARFQASAVAEATIAVYRTAFARAESHSP
jgi:glycosyltransferase involved in cell wall biosynthesis